MPLYDTIKAQTVNFPLPKPKDTVTIGTLKTATDFEYAWPEIKRSIITPPDFTNRDGPNRAERETVGPIGCTVEIVNVYDLTLRFYVDTRQNPLSVSVPGQAAAVAPAGQNYVEIDVVTSNPNKFTLTNGTTVFSGELVILRYIAGAGAITIPALPITILYAPPVDQQKKNVASWTTIDLAGNLTTVSYSDQESTTVPIDSTFQNWLALTGEMKYAAQVLNNIKGNTYAQIIGGVLGTLAGLLGASTATGTVGTTVTSQQSLSITLAAQDGLSTDPSGGGPGKGDVIYLLRNARVCWYTNGGPIQLALLGWDAEATLTASLLQDPNGPTGLDLPTRTALLNLDPFVAGGPSAIPPAPRFVRVDTFDINAPHMYTVTYSLTSQDLEQKATMEGFMQDDTASLFAFADIGVTDTSKGQATLTETSAAQSTTSQTITRQVQFFANPTEYYSVEVYCDVVFGTFAFRSLPQVIRKQLTGVIRKSGQAQPFTEVLLESNGQTYRTLTDANGNYEFWASTIQPGNAKVLSQGSTMAVQILKAPAQVIDSVKKPKS